MLSAVTSLSRRLFARTFQTDRQLHGRISRAQKERVESDERPALIYAIGDVHGHLQLLRRLEQLIVEDAKHVAGDKWIVLLGDFVDRGPDTAQVLDHLIAPAPAGLLRKCIAGNHELMMERFLSSPSESWLRMGGVETLLSYGIPPEQLRATSLASKRFWNLLRSHIPEDHLDFLKSLPTAISVDRYVLVHAGARTDMPLATQSDEELTGLIDSSRSSLQLSGRIVVHGHTVVERPTYSFNRISVDTGAYMSGKLSAVRLDPYGNVRFFEVCT